MDRRGMTMMLPLVFFLFVASFSNTEAGRGQEYKVERVEEGQKNYTGEEEGKIFPAR